MVVNPYVVMMMMMMCGIDRSLVSRRERSSNAMSDTRYLLQYLITRGKKGDVIAPFAPPCDPSIQLRA